MSGSEPARWVPPDSPLRLRIIRDRTGADVAATERAVAELLSGLGKDPGSAHLADTPRCVAAVLCRTADVPARAAWRHIALHGLVRDEARTREQVARSIGDSR